MDDYCAEFQGITVCRFFAAGQQKSCKGFGRRSDRQNGQCVHWRNYDGTYHCTHPDVQAAAVQEFKALNLCAE